MQALEETLFLNKTLKVYQPKGGFRFSIDSVLLANFVELKKGEKVLEIGAGTGIIGFILLKKYPHSKIYFLEIEELFIEAIKRGIRANSFENRAFLIKGDALFPPFKREIFDVIFANPPYFKKGSGRESPKFLENLARREELFTLNIFLEKCAQLLKNKGRLYLIFTAYRLAELLFYLKSFRLEPKLIKFIYPSNQAHAKMVLIKAMKGAREGLLITSPCYLSEERADVYSSQESSSF